jgi:hypothetical protein
MIIIWIIFILLASAASGLASAWTGSGGERYWRRFIVPAGSALFGILAMWSLWPVLLMARCGPNSMGYGMPSPDDPKPSVLGKFWTNVFNGDLKKGSIFTRGTIGVMEMISCLIVPIVSPHWWAWILWIIFGGLIVWNGIWWGAIKEKEGQFLFRGRMLNWEEFALEAIDTALILILVILCR